MSTIDTRPKQTMSRSRNDFDMSQRVLFTSSVGQCLPVYYDLLSPNDKVQIDSALLTRTQTLKSNPMTRVQEHIDYFFVPYKRVFTNFNQWYTMMMHDVHSVLLNDTQLKKVIPSLNLAQLVREVPQPDASMSRQEINDLNYSDEFGVLKMHNAQRLLDLLNFGHWSFQRFQNGGDNIKINPALICAYHAINHDFYRLTDRTNPDVELANMDNYNVAPPRGDRFLSIYYRPWRRDFYTNLEVSPLFGGYNEFNFNENLPEKFLSPNQAYLYNQSGQYLSPGSDIPMTTAGAYGEGTNNGNTLDALRRAAALERLSQLQRFNEKFWNYQMSALFGLEVPDNYDHVVYLGSHHSNIQFSDVVASATTDQSVLGEIAGKGLNIPKGSKTIEYTTKQHGFIMGIYSATPIADYLATGIDRINTYHTLNDFYQSAYDNLGMQPKYYYENNFDVNTATNNTILGWTYRWQELKEKPDVVHGAFVSSLRHWVTSRNSQVFGTDYKNFVISPKFLDSIMLAVFGLNPTPQSDMDDEDFKREYINSAFGRDPLLHELYFKSTKYSNMSKFSLPSHNSVML